LNIQIEATCLTEYRLLSKLEKAYQGFPNTFEKQYTLID